MFLSSCAGKYLCGAASDGWLVCRKSEDSSLTSPFCSFFGCWFGLSISAGCCSGDAELDAALLSRSSNRFLSFLPVLRQGKFYSDILWDVR